MITLFLNLSVIMLKGIYPFTTQQYSLKTLRKKNMQLHFETITRGKNVGEKLFLPWANLYRKKEEKKEKKEKLKTAQMTLLLLATYFATFLKHLTHVSLIYMYVDSATIIRQIPSFLLVKGLTIYHNIIVAPIPSNFVKL